MKLVYSDKHRYIALIPSIGYWEPYKCFSDNTMRTAITIRFLKYSIGLEFVVGKAKCSYCNHISGECQGYEIHMSSIDVMNYKIGEPDKLVNLIPDEHKSNT